MLKYKLSRYFPMLFYNWNIEINDSLKYLDFFCFDFSII